MNMYEYRTFEIIPKEISQFDQLDLYFFKPNSAAVGVKSRFHGNAVKQPYWDINKVEFKFIKNYDQIKQGKTKIEYWRKVVLSCKFTVYSPAYIKAHPQQFRKFEQTLDSSIQRQLKQITFAISQTLKNSDIKEKHFKRNPQLARWLQSESPVVDIFLVEKQKQKLLGGQSGYVRASLLYDQARIKYITNYQTFATESTNQSKLLAILKKESSMKEQNTSYPTFLQKLYQHVL